MNINDFIKGERESRLSQLRQEQAEVQADLDNLFPVKYIIIVNGTVRWSDWAAPHEAERKEINLQEPMRRAKEKYRRQRIWPVADNQFDITVTMVLASGTEIPVPKILWEQWL